MANINRISLAALAAFAISSSNVAAEVYERKMQGPTLKELVSKPQEVKGGIVEISKRVQSCVVKVFLGDERLGIDRRDKSAPIFELNDPDAGLLVFRGRVLGAGWADTWTTARYTVEIKQERYRITLSAFHRENIGDVVIAWGTGGEPQVKLLEASVDQLAQCVKEQSDW